MMEAVSPNTNTNADLPAKYQRLAAEFSRIRAQNVVLKKAVIDEQGKSAQLKDDLQTKDQALRKTEQEIDSLTFRNVQLEKRVGFLQEELANAVKKYKEKGKTKAGNSTEATTPEYPVNQAAVDYELLTKIQENMELHNKISSMEEEHKNEVISLQQQVVEASKSEIIEQFQNRVEQLEQEKASLNRSLQNQKDEIEAYKDQVQLLQEKIQCLTTATPNTLSRSESSYSNANNNGSLSDEDMQTTADKLTKALQERERLLLEYQLLKLKHSKTTMKLEEAKNIMSTLGHANLISEENTPCTEAFESITTLMGTLDVVSHDLQNNGAIYKSEVKEYLTKRINELISLLQLADSKAVTFYTECQSLQNLLSISADKIKNMESLMAHNQNQYANLQDELERTKENYESQLTAMTEHLAVMNDTLAQQKEQIDQLTHELLQAQGKTKKK